MSARKKPRDVVNEGRDQALRVPGHEGHGDGACLKLASTMDRHNEAHWLLHHLNAYYHQADAFRYSLNSFIRVMKEVPQLITMELQGQPGFSTWFAPHRAALFADPLFAKLAKQRDFIVHRGMLVPRSWAHVGVVNGPDKFFKLAIPFPASPLDDSDEIMRTVVAVCREVPTIRGLIRPEPGQHPCISRRWELEAFPDEEIRHVAVRAWKRVGELIATALTWLGHPPTSYDYPCLPSHEDARVGWKDYPSSIFQSDDDDGGVVSS